MTGHLTIALLLVLELLAVSMFMQPLESSYGLLDALAAGWSL